MDAWQMVAELRARRRMYIPEGSYAAVVAFLVGFDEAHSGGLLAGFQEFVELKFGSHSSIDWSTLALRIEPTVEEHADDAKVDRLLDLLEEFLAVDGGLHGRRRLFHEWLALRTPDADLLRFSQSPAPATVSVDDAARLLAVDRREVFRLIHEQRLGKVGRVGSDVRIQQEAVQTMLDAPDSG
jgi:excisionase family DNA binding protein